MRSTVQTDDAVESVYDNVARGTYMGELGTGVEEVQEQGTNAAVHIQHQISCLAKGILLHFHSKVHVLSGREELVSILLQQFHPLVPIVLHSRMISTHLRDGNQYRQDSKSHMAALCPLLQDSGQ